MRIIIRTLLLITTGIFLIQPSRAQLVNPNATAETLELKQLLDSIYGHKIIAGQCDDQYLQYIQTVTGGKSPAIMGYDFNGICPTQNGNNDAFKATRWVKDQKGIAQFQWHWISPNGDGDWSSPNFNLAEALADTLGSSYQNMIRDIDLVAVELKKMQDSLVPVLWRPLHEAEGAWFWWGFSGKEACIQLYRLMYNRLVNYHQLNNLIWVWNSYGTDKPNWYPGDDVVDIIAWDYPRYTGNNNSWNQYQQLFGDKNKLFGIGEDGHLTDPEIFEEQPWLYFLTWAYMINDNNTPDWINQVYNDPRVFTLDDLVPGPKAKAGRSQLLFDSDGNGIETALLNGSASSTDQGSIVSYKWYENDILIAEGVQASIDLTLGIHSIRLTIETTTGQTASGNVVVTVKKPSLSLLMPHQVSSTEANLGNIASNAVDGDESTRWSSLYSDPQWFIIDLGKTYLIQEVILKWEVASARNYKIEVSENGNSWTTLATKTNMANGARIDIISGLIGKGRYIRMYGSQRTTNYGYSIYEFEVYGNLSSGIQATDNEGLEVYPTLANADSKLNLRLPAYLPDGIITIKNATGQCVQKTAFSGTDTFIQLDGSLRSGVYFLSVEGRELFKTVRFFIR